MPLDIKLESIARDYRFIKDEYKNTRRPEIDLLNTAVRSSAIKVSNSATMRLGDIDSEIKWVNENLAFDEREAVIKAFKGVRSIPAMKKSFDENISVESLTADTLDAYADLSAEEKIFYRTNFGFNWDSLISNFSQGLRGQTPISFIREGNNFRVSNSLQIKDLASGVALFSLSGMTAYESISSLPDGAIKDYATISALAVSTGFAAYSFATADNSKRGVSDFNNLIEKARVIDEFKLEFGLDKNVIYNS